MIKRSDDQMSVRSQKSKASLLKHSKANSYTKLFRSIYPISSICSMYHHTDFECHRGGRRQGDALT